MFGVNADHSFHHGSAVIPFQPISSARRVRIWDYTHTACIINACSGLKSHSKWDTKLEVGCMIQTSHHSGISMQNTNTQSQRDLSLTEGQLWKGLSFEQDWLLLYFFSREPLNVHHVLTISIFFTSNFFMSGLEPFLSHSFTLVPAGCSREGIQGPHEKKIKK